MSKQVYNGLPVFLQHLTFQQTQTITTTIRRTPTAERTVIKICELFSGDERPQWLLYVELQHLNALFFTWLLFIYYILFGALTIYTLEEYKNIDADWRESSPPCHPCTYCTTSRQKVKKIVFMHWFILRFWVILLP